MKKYLFISFLTVLTNAFVFGQNSATEDLVKNLAKRQLQWTISGQLDSLEASLDDRLKFIHSNGWIQTKKDVIDDLRSKKLIYEKIEISEMDVRIFENTAIIIGKGKFTGLNTQKPFVSDLLFTEVFVKSKGRWLLAGRHANKFL
jgi:Domain of unknown function (DUF4440)